MIDTKNNDSIKLIDFGFSQPYARDDHTMTLIAGSPHYIAPEVIEGKYDEKCDLWGIGVILYTILCGLAPFEGENNDEIIEKVKIGHFEFPKVCWKDKSPEVKDLIKKLLTKDPEKRICAKEAI